MCAGLAVMCGPPTVGGACYLTWLKGKAAVLAKKGLGDVESSFQANAASLASVAVTYELQRRVVVSHFDEGGALSLNWKKGTESCAPQPPPLLLMPLPTLAPTPAHCSAWRHDRR